jgi:F-type H+-transporting ATPase subunit b
LKLFLFDFRRSGRYLLPLFLAALALSLASSPARLIAQAPAQPAASPEPWESEAAQKSLEKDQDPDDAFRHSKFVQAISDAIFHDDRASRDVPHRLLRREHVEITARSFEIFNFAIIFFAVGIPLVRFMPKLIKKRRQDLTSKIDSARKMTEDANSRLSAVEAKLAQIDQEIAKFRLEVEEGLKADEQRIKSSIGEESVRIVAAAEQEIGVAAAQARRALRTFAAGLAIDQAAQQIVLTPETDRALIAEFAANASKGGKN